MASVPVSLRRGFDVDAMSAAGLYLTTFLKGWGRSGGFKRLGRSGGRGKGWGSW